MCRTPCRTNQTCSSGTGFDSPSEKTMLTCSTLSRRPPARRGRLGHELVEHVSAVRPSAASSGRGGTVELRDRAGCPDPVGRRDLDGADVVAVVVAGPWHRRRWAGGRTGEQADRIKRRGHEVRRHALRCKRASARDQSCRCATRSCGTESGSPICRSSPSGPAISSAKKRPSVRPAGSVRRISSDSYQPSVIAWYPCRVPGGHAGLLRREHRRKLRRVGDVPHGWRWFQHTQSGLVASSCRTVTSALPACANSGQWSTTLSS